jgi:negative regulator of sigma E activity
MEKDKKNRLHVSELMDGELDHRQLASVMSHIKQVSGREQWDTYHLIGDTLRSVDTTDVLSKNFSKKMAARLEQEPSYIQPIKQRAVNISVAWRAAAVGMAVITGVLLAPTILYKPAQTSSPLTLSIPDISAPAPVLLADGNNEHSHAEQRHYLLWHQNSTSSLYGLRVSAHAVASTGQQ